jgi:dTMP kinase
MPLITFEGSEACGKSTQVQRLASRLKENGASVCVVREPGGTAIGETIRDLLQHADENHNMTPETELLLFAASRAQLVREKIQPLLARGEFVICDRFFDSTTVYQGAARALDLHLVRKLNQFAAGDCIPDITFLLETDRLTARQRLADRESRDRMEELPEEFHERVIAAYHELAQREPKRIIVIDGRLPVAEISERIWQAVDVRLLTNQQSAIRNQQLT